MSTLTLNGNHIDVHFSLGEKIGGLIRDQRIPLDSVTSAELITDPIAATRGWRAPGLGIPGVRKIGHWRGPAGHELVCIRRGEPAVRLRLHNQPFDSVLLGMPDADEKVREIQTSVS